MGRCIACGKREEFKDHLCKNCYIREHPIIKSIKPFTIRKCSKCGRIQVSYKGFFPPEIGLKKELIKHIKPNPEYVIKNILIESREEKNIMAIDLRVMAIIENKKVEEDYFITLPIEKTICDKCEALKSQYFEGVLQVRCVREDILKKILRMSLNQPEIVKKDSLVKYQNGFDIKFRDTSKARKMVEEFKKMFKGYSTYSNELYKRDRQTSKAVLRTNIKYVPLPFRVGDIIETNHKTFEIRKTEPLMLYDIEKKELKQFHKTLAEENFRFIKPQQCQLIKKKPNPAVLHPFNFQEIRLRNPQRLRKNIKIGEYVKAVIVKEEAYIVDGS